MSILSLDHQPVVAINEIEQPALEDAVFPKEFLYALKDTGFQAMKDLLSQLGAPQAAFELLEDLQVLDSWAGQVEKEDKVRPVVNVSLIDAVSSLSRNIVSAGGVFYSSGAQCTIRREIVMDEQ